MKSDKSALRTNPLRTRTEGEEMSDVILHLLPLLFAIGLGAFFISPNGGAGIKLATDANATDVRRQMR